MKDSLGRRIQPLAFGLLLFPVPATASAPTPARRPLKTVSLGFVRTTVTAEGKEVLTGEAYYRRPNHLHIEITDPIKQVLVVRDTSLLIYYPDRGKAFQVDEQASVKMPFIQSLLSMLRGRWAMAEAGFQLAGEESRGQRVLQRWEPPAKTKALLGAVTLTSEGERLVELEARDATGRVALKSTFSEHADLAGRQVPMRVHSEIAQGIDGAIEIEDVIYSNVRIDVPLPDSISSFRVPPSVPIKAVKW